MKTKKENLKQAKLSTFLCTQQGKGEVISLALPCHFHPLHRHLDVSRAITAESSPLHISYRSVKLEPGTFDFRAQVANHYATHPYIFLQNYFFFDTYKCYIFFNNNSKKLILGYANKKLDIEGYIYVHK